MSVIFLRSVIIYFVVIFAIRFMGKRQVGELQPSEFVVAMLISEVAAIPIEDINMPLLAGILPIITLLCFEVILSYLALKNCVVRDFVTGRPSILIHNGTINQKEMEKTRINMDDLIKELRLKDILNINDVRYAILETNGQLSVFTNSDTAYVTVKDLHLPTTDSPLPFIIISGGKLNRYNLNMLEKNETWLYEELKQKNIYNHKDVLYMSCDEKNDVMIIPKEKKGNRR